MQFNVNNYGTEEYREKMEIEKLKIDLKSSDPLKRRIAAEEFISNNYFDSDILNAFVDGLTGNDKGFKDVAFYGLTQTFGDVSKEAAGKVVKLIKSDNIETRNLAGDLLVNLGDIAEYFLLDYIDDLDADIRKFAIDILGLISINKHILKTLLNKINDEDSNVYLSVIEAVGNIIENVPDIADDEIINTLINKYNKSEDSKVFVIESFGKFKSQKTTEFIFEKMKEEDDKFIQLACIDSLSTNASDKYIVDDLIQLIYTVDDTLKTLILKTILAVSQRLEVPVSIPDDLRETAHKALKDNDNEIRAAGLLALGNIYKLEDVEYLINEIKYFNPETALHILYNLINNSPYEVTYDFILKYANLMEVEKEGNGITELFSYISNAWLDADLTSKQNVLKALLDTAINKNDFFVIKAIKILHDLDEDIVQYYIKEYLSKLDNKKVAILKDLIYFVNT